MRKRIIDFSTLLIILVLVERLGLTIPKVYVFYFGMFCGIVIWGVIDLLKNYIDYLE